MHRHDVLGREACELGDRSEVGAVVGHGDRDRRRLDLARGVVEGRGQRARPGRRAPRRPTSRARCDGREPRRRGAGTRLAGARRPGPPPRCPGTSISTARSPAGRTHDLGHANGARSNPAALELVGDPRSQAERRPASRRARRSTAPSPRPRDRRRLPRGVVLAEQVAGRSARDERAVRQVAAVGERLARPERARPPRPARAAPSRAGRERRGCPPARRAPATIAAAHVLVDGSRGCRARRAASRSVTAAPSRAAHAVAARRSALRPRPRSLVGATASGRRPNPSRSR